MLQFQSEMVLYLAEKGRALELSDTSLKPACAVVAGYGFAFRLIRCWICGSVGFLHIQSKDIEGVLGEDAIV